MPKHLYIHIPFCKSICTYCDFKRFVCNKKDINEYTTKIISEINKKYKDCKFESIYIGGGTPNYLDDQTLSSLLSTLSKLQGKNCEFTIECNPEFVTQNQSAILKTHGVNRISLGVQTVNNKILSKYNRHHTKKDVIKAIKFLRANNIENISVDFMYGFNETSLSDLKKDIVFLKKYKIPHCSFYSLEIKSGSVLNKQNYKLDEDKVQEQLEYIVDHMPLNRYEVSSWAIDKQHESIHNKAYWETRDWIGLGLGAFGFENKIYYQNIGSIKKWTKKTTKYTQKDLYLQIIMMGLRLKEGIDLSVPLNKKAYLHFKKQLKYTTIKNNRLLCNNINLLDNTLIELI